DVGVAVQRPQLRRREAAYQIPDRRPALIREPPVDPADGFVELALQGPILRDLFPRRHQHLGENEPPQKLRKALEQPLNREHALEDPFGIVEAVETDDAGRLLWVPRGRTGRARQ